MRILLKLQHKLVVKHCSTTIYIVVESDCVNNLKSKVKEKLVIDDTTTKNEDKFEDCFMEEDNSDLKYKFCPGI